MSDPTPPTGTPAASDDDLNGLLAMMPYAATLGISLQSASAEEVIGSLAWAPELCTAGGLLHGGALIGLADTVGAVCAFLGLPSDASTATTSSTTHLFTAVRDGSVTATARPLHRGCSLIIVQTDLADTHGRPIAQITQSQAVLRR
ncbi:MAG: PaaI family thioesterase [Solirubrobacteraceae bacterium]